MNLSNPLWPSKKRTGNNNIDQEIKSVGSVISVSHARYRLFTRTDFLAKSFRGMNLSNALGLSAKLAGNKTSNHNNTVEESANTSLQAHNDAVVNAINGSGPHLWNFKSYWYITVPLTIATIVLPVVAGAIFRTVLIAFKRYNSYLRWSLPLLCLGAVVVMIFKIDEFIFLFIFGVPLGIVAFGMLIRVSRTGNQEILWCTFAALVPYSVFIDITVAFTGITAYLPLVYLFIVWLRQDIRTFLKFRFRYSRTLRSYFSPVALLLQRVRGFFDRHRILEGFVFAGIYVGIVVPIVLFRSWLTCMITFAIPLGILAINRLLRSQEKRERLVWLIYTGLYVVSVLLDVGYFAVPNTVEYTTMDYDYRGKPRHEHRRPYRFLAWVPVTWVAIVRFGIAMVRLSKRADRKPWKLTGRATKRT